MLYIFDRNENLLEIISNEDYENFTYVEKINNENSFKFETNKNKNLIKYNKVGFFNEYNEFQLFYIDDPVEFKSFDKAKIEVECLADYYELGNKIIEDKRVINGALRVAAEKALEGTNYQVGVVEDFELKDINFYFCSSLKAVQDILKVYNCEMNVRIEIDEDTGLIANKYIDFVHRVGEDTALRFTYDTALESVEKSYVEGHYNVLFGRGKAIETENGGYSRKLDFAEVNAGLRYIEDTESILKYGRIEGVYENSNIEDPNILLEKTREKLKETKELKLSYKVTVNDLSEIQGFEHYKNKKGDTIIILDEEENEVIEARIIEKIATNENTVLTLGNFLPGFIENESSDLGSIKDKIDIIDNAPITENKYPDLLPSIPTLKANGLYSTVALEWTYENKIYYTYEIYASKLKDFNPDITNRIFEGKASAFLHEVKPSETWYYKVRAKNTHGKYTDFSLQADATTNKISDATEFFEYASIADAIIGELRLDRGWVGQLKGNWIDAKQLSVTDGNGKRTLDIDSFGNVNLDVTSFKINSKHVSTTEETKELLNNETGPLEERIIEAEQKITSDAIINSVSEALNDGKGITSTSTVLTKDHFKVKNGSNDSYTLAPNNFTMHNGENGSETLKIINENCYYDGTNTYTYGPVLKPSSGSAHININDANKTNEGNNFMRFNKAGWIAVNRGITFNRYIVTEGINRDTNRTTSFGSGNADAGGQGIFSHYTNELNVYVPGAARCWLNYRNWSSETRIGNGDGQGGLGKLTCGSLEVTGTKKNIVSTKNFGFIGMQAYEMVDCWYGDIGSGITDDKGICYVHINPVFKETVNTDIDYKVFISIKDEDLKEDEFVMYKVSTSNPNFFRVKTNIPNIRFDYEIKARRKGYENIRLERSTYEEEMPKILQPVISEVEAQIKENEDELKRNLSIMALDEISIENNANMLKTNEISIENNINMLRINELIKKEREI